VVYLAQELGAKKIGLGIGLILAARHVVGLLRLGAPVVIGRLIDRKRFCLAAYLANGITQSAQYTYPKDVLDVRLFALLALQTAMFCGQWAVGPWLGWLADRLGNRPVMIGSLLLAAQGPLFYYLATPERRWWFAGAWAVWIAYAELNVCLPNLMLKLSPGQSSTPYIATYFAVTGLCYAVNTIGGGAMLDRYGGHILTLPGELTLGYYQSVFLLGWLARGLGLLVLLLVIEPPSRRW
jgi:predicted MFS family arabinose efflux permease